MLAACNKQRSFGSPHLCLFVRSSFGKSRRDQRKSRSCIIIIIVISSFLPFLSERRKEEKEGVVVARSITSLLVREQTRTDIFITDRSCRLYTDNYSITRIYAIYMIRNCKRIQVQLLEKKNLSFPFLSSPSFLPSFVSSSSFPRWENKNLGNSFGTMLQKTRLSKSIYRGTDLCTFSLSRRSFREIFERRKSRERERERESLPFPELFLTILNKLAA